MPKLGSHRCPLKYWVQVRVYETRQHFSCLFDWTDILYKVSCSAWSPVFITTAQNYKFAKMRLHQSHISWVLPILISSLQYLITPVQGTRYVHISITNMFFMSKLMDR